MTKEGVFFGRHNLAGDLEFCSLARLLDSQVLRARVLSILICSVWFISSISFSRVPYSPGFLTFALN